MLTYCTPYGNVKRPESEGRSAASFSGRFKLRWRTERSTQQAVLSFGPMTQSSGSSSHFWKWCPTGVVLGFDSGKDGVPQGPEVNTASKGPPALRNWW